MYTSDVLSQMAAEAQPRKRESEIRKEAITQNRQQIAALKVRIGELASEHGPLVNRIANNQQIESLRAGIANLEVGIKAMENGLEMLIAVENAAEKIGAKMEEEERAKAEADRAAHEAAVKAVVLAEWLEVPGQSESSFEAAWPEISRKIAMERAVAAGLTVSEQKHQANPVAQFAKDMLDQRYAAGSRSAGSVQVQPGEPGAVLIDLA